MHVSPEGFLTGYHADEAIAREEALEVGGGLFCEWLELFSGYSMTAIVGFTEREGPNLYDSAAVIENGKLLGVQRKHYLYRKFCTPGTDVLTFRSKGITFGVVICLDTNYFEPARLVALQGASIVFSPMCNRLPVDHEYAQRPSYYSHFVARSFENRLWLLSADWVWPNDLGEVCPGNSVLYSSDGKEVARSKEGHEELLVYSIPVEQLKKEKGQRVHGSPFLAKKLMEQLS